MMIRYARSGGFRPPRDREILTIEEDGTFTMWRSVGSAVHPPSPVGRFAGQLDPQTRESLINAVTAVSLEGDLEIIPKPGSAIVNIETDQVHARMGIHDEPNNSWADIAKLLQELLGKLTSSPVAAMKLAVSEGGKEARLIHLGQQPLILDLSALSVRAVLWEGHKKEDDWSTSGSMSGENDQISTGMNWEMDLPFDHQFDPTDEQSVVAYVTFSISHKGRVIPVKLNSS